MCSTEDMFILLLSVKVDVVLTNAIGTAIQRMMSSGELVQLISIAEQRVIQLNR